MTRESDARGLHSEPLPSREYAVNFHITKEKTHVWFF